MLYIAGVIEEISQEGIWQKARLEGSDVFEDVIVMKTYITINPMESAPLTLKCSAGLAMNISKGDIKHIFYDKNGIKEVYSEKKYCLSKILKSRLLRAAKIY